MELPFLGTKRNSCTTVMLTAFLVLSWLGYLESQAQLLDKEAQALQQIATKQNITRWEAVPESCVPYQRNNIRGKTGDITCHCNVTCHITEIKLVRLKLSGDLPVQFANFTYLKEIDLTGNIFNGTIPSEWAKLNLTSLYLGQNNISGTIPKEIGDISTLEELNLEDNKLIGDLPPELGNLIRLRKILFSGNDFTGPLPGTFAKLQKLTNFEIRGTKISGKIPEFIGDWTNLDVLDLQGTSMTGSIPSTISRLTNLTRLMISDLHASVMPFPDLRNLFYLKILVLRKCEITGSIPSYIGENMLDMTNLDLSFNKMNGNITKSLANLSNLKFMYLTNNLLTGKVPSWLSRNEGNNYDISYNKFTGGAGSCNNTKVLNLISSYSSVKEDAINDDDQWCLTEGFQCFDKRRYYELFINCGGGGMNPFEEDDEDKDNGDEAEDDEEDEVKEKSKEDENGAEKDENGDDNDYDDVKKDEGKWGPSTFVSRSGKWALSSTGDYMDSKGARYRQSSRVNSTYDISTTARLAPLSLKYYGLCLRNGNYTVLLHFSEIVLPRKGKRIFDIYIQGQLVEKDFNIALVAGGINIPIIRNYTAKVENTSTLEIHLYWAGKGTMSVARGGQYGQYGPLISAISITPNFNPHPGLSAGPISGIVVASLVGVLLIVTVLHIKGYLGVKDVVDEELRGLELQTGYYSLRQIKNATDNFSSANKIGQGGFGAVYKGALSDGSEIAVKQLSSKSRQGNREFLTEIGMLSALHHPHLVKLFGCCIEGNQLLIIYEYMANNSLARALFGPQEERLNLDWPTRQKICVGIARGLVYLHEESRLKIIHRDMKTTNVLLDKELNAKICDFGLAKLDEEEDTHISTRIAGTIGYMSPEYAMRGYLTEKADVYSFGIVALEIVSGKSNTNYRPKQEFMYLLDWACVLQEQGNLLQLVDECLERNYSKEEALNMLNIGLMCTNISPTLRPTMSAVVSMLEGDTPVEPTHFVGGSVSAHMKLKVLENNSQESHTQTSFYPCDSQTQSISEDGPFVDFSSISLSCNGVSKSYSSTTKLLPDLYDVHLTE